LASVLYKANAGGRSTFTDGRLRGAFLGGGGRWPDRAQLGRVIERTAVDGTAIYGRARIAPGRFQWGCVHRRASPRASPRTQRELTVQLNVTNLTDEDELEPLRPQCPAKRRT
jgi:hypothetical protein